LGKTKLKGKDTHSNEGDTDMNTIYRGYDIEQDNKATCDGDLRCIERMNDATL
jgi:hypothetical protein